MMDLEVVGRHALLFDDDANATFVNSRDALVEWYSLVIDRYDVRHLLQHPPPPLKKQCHHPSSPTSSESELDQERYLDLPPPDDHDSLSLLESDNGPEPAVGGGYHAVTFSYGNPDVSTDKENSDAGFGRSVFLPPFLVPESLLQNLPPTEKVHQIIARTAIFVRKHGGQSEFVLNVKQRANRAFGFLMPDHHLHAYFKFLVDHVDLLNSDVDAEPVHEKNEDSGNNPKIDVFGGALSLLGSLYGSGEDEEGTFQFVSESIEKEPGESLDPANAIISHGSECAESSVGLAGKVEEVSNTLLCAAKEKSPFSKRNRTVTADNSDATSSRKREGDARGLFGVSVEEPWVSTLPSTSRVEPLILEPPSHLKRMVDKIVEFILKKGKEFEALVIEQDSKNGRFPFLLPSNQYHPYYLKVLQKSQESKFPGGCFAAPNHDTMGNVTGKKGRLKDDNDAIPKGSSVSDIPFDSERKEKFKMVIGGSKKDAQDLPPKPIQKQSGVSVDTAAAILLAATRGLRYHKSDIIPKKSMDDSSLGLSEGEPTSSFGSLYLQRGQSSTQKPIPNGETHDSMSIELSRSVGQSEMEGSRTSDVSMAKAIAKAAALTAASEADSSEASLTKEQNQKAERLKRAKMFAVMIKGGTASNEKDPLSCLSAEPPDSMQSGLLDSGSKASTMNDATLAPDTSKLSVAEVDLLGIEREGGTAPVDAKTSNESKSGRHDSGDNLKERKLRKYRPRSRTYEEGNDDDDDGRDHKHSRKKHRSHRSSSSKDERKHRKRHSSPDYGESRHSRHKHHRSSEDEHKHGLRSKKHSCHSGKKVELENDVSTEDMARTNAPRVDDSGNGVATRNSLKEPREGSNPLAAGTIPSDTTIVSDDLRAKVRAMLLATM
ncbi:hypothetical protein NE237_032567 [Protea cynaroides]|uniref:SURP motif domain-containing protein n=1 Tax=Protea cynaroides TaxID=273540 RepID=A0A9Q0R380_9MAGN|nr:hypothetical protein NE237_032567 [Protea cynaroides]